MNMLASERNGEVVAAARAIVRTLKAAGADKKNRQIGAGGNLLRLKKNLAGESQSAIVHRRPLLALAVVASVGHLQKMPANSASPACWPVLPPR